MINVVCGIGSTGRICTDLAVALESKGHEVKIAYGRGTVPKQFQKYAIRIGNDWDIRWHGLKARFFDAMGFGSERATKKFISWIESYNPDVIHLHNIHGYYLNIRLLFKYLKTCNKKILWTLHDCWAFTGHSAYCDSISCERWKNGCYSCPLKYEYPKSFIDNSKYNWQIKKKLITDLPKTMRVITPSYWLADLVGESFMNKFNTQVIHNGIDTSIFYPRKSEFREKHGLKDQFLILGVASVWNDMKGFSDFILLSKKIPSHARIILVGVTKKQLEKLPDNIIGITRTNNIDEMAEIYSTADVFLNLTYCDNYPTVNLEAQACGTPCITYRTGGSIESVPSKNVAQRGALNEIIKLIMGKLKILGIPQDKNTMLNKYLKIYEILYGR